MVWGNCMFDFELGIFDYFVIFFFLLYFVVGCFCEKKIIR